MMKPISEYGEVAGYQDIRVNGALVHKGLRECDARWNMIRPFIGEGQVVIDVGSNAGYFSIRCAEAGALVWSMEGAPERCTLQRDILEANETHNVCLTKKQMTVADWANIAGSVNQVDTILVLSVLEYLPLDEFLETLHLFALISPQIIIEWPNPDETKLAVGGDHNTICSFDPEKHLGWNFAHVEALGESPSHLPGNPLRKMYRAWNDSLYRNGLISYIHCDSMRRRTLSRRKINRGYDAAPMACVLDGRIDIASSPGVNLLNMALHGIVYPDPEHLHVKIHARYDELIGVYGAITDTHLRNVLWRGPSIFIIDYLEHYGLEAYGASWDEYAAAFGESYVGRMSVILETLKTGVFK